MFFPVELCKSYNISFMKSTAVGYFKPNAVNEKMYYFMELSVIRLFFTVKTLPEAACVSLCFQLDTVFSLCSTGFINFILSGF